MNPEIKLFTHDPLCYPRVEFGGSTMVATIPGPHYTIHTPQGSLLKGEGHILVVLVVVPVLPHGFESVRLTKDTPKCEQSVGNVQQWLVLRMRIRDTWIKNWGGGVDP